VTIPPPLAEQVAQIIRWNMSVTTQAPARRARCRVTSQKLRERN